VDKKGKLLNGFSGSPTGLPERGRCGDVLLFNMDFCMDLNGVLADVGPFPDGYVFEGL
jgi:hypothetical protein